MKRTLIPIFCLALALLLPLGAQAQAVLGTIQGTISDESGAAIPGATVTIDNNDTGGSRTVFSGDRGLYVAKALTSGNYNVTASLEGMQTVRQEGVVLLLGQTVDLNFSIGVETVTEAITVTSTGALVETSRSSAASYISEQEIEAYPILGRDFKDFALLTPTVQKDTSRGFVTMAGQRGIYTGMNIDGTSAKNAFFGYGSGGEATENDGLVVAQDSVKEFQVVTSGFAPEQGASGGGYINVVTKSGTNALKGAVSYLFTDDSMKADIPATPLDKARGNNASSPVSTFEREEIGLSLGGPIKKDKVHFFLAADTTTRDEPFRQDLRTRGAYDAILLVAQSNPDYAGLVDGFTPNNDGTAAPDPINGRTATGLFTRSVENTIFFGKLDFQPNPSNSAAFRFNYTDYERTSSYKDEESLKTEETNTMVGSLVSVIGSNKVNEFRIQSAYDDLARNNLRVGDPIEAQIRFRSNRDAPDSFTSSGAVGKFDFLPILADTETLAFQNNFSYLFGEHDLKFGIDYTDDNMKQLFAGSLDGRYDFRTMSDFLANNASQVRIYFGNVSFPNYDEKQIITSLYAQDAYKPNSNLTLNYGIRWQMTDSPSGLTHVFPVGESIPDDTDNYAPRFGFAYTPGGTGKHVVRGGIGLFHGRTPTLLYASQIQENGLFPNFGRVTVRPGQAGFVPVGTPIDNLNPPLTTIPSTSYFQPNFEDPETWRVNLGYERELAANWSAGADFVYADATKLQRNDDLNREIAGVDEFGRVIYTGNFSRPDPNFNTIFVRESNGKSEYTALTLKANRRYSGRFQMQAHYTWSEDKSDDDNERSATGVTITDPTNPSYEFGLSSRDVTNRVVVSGIVELPLGIRLSGGLEYRDGRPWTILDPNTNVHQYPGFNGPAARGIVNGQLVGRNTQRNESIQTINLRVSKVFDIGKYGIDLFGEAFNLFDENSFSVVGSQAQVGNSEFGVADSQVTGQRQYQIGFRVNFN